MLERETLIASLNEAGAAVAALRQAEVVDTDALTSAIILLDAIRCELSAHDVTSTPAVIVPAAPAAPATFASALRETGIIDRAVNGQFGNAQIEGRDIFTGGGMGSLDILVPEYDGTIDRRPRRALTLLDVVPVRATTAETLNVFVQTGFSSAAAPVARRTGGTYGSYVESGISVERQTVTVAKVGHYVRTDIDSLADQGQLDSLLQDELAYGVREAIEAQLVAATDTTNGIKSLLTGAQEMTYAIDADGAAKLDAIRLAKTASELALLPADFVALNPLDIEAIELAKDGMERYLAGGPFAGGPATVWGLNIVVNHALPAGTMIVGSTRAVTLFTRRNTEIMVSENVGDDFLQDAVRIKASARVALSNRRPEAMVVITELVD
jgi:HK97 family phage major capsid protein